ncbi:MAG: hypothetical protein KDA91_22365, partial [Planctomycetaceae bacterium]|nr:hypothetical protein [Planctomycetaceae bacterium]
ELFNPPPDRINRRAARECGCGDQYWVARIDFNSSTTGRVNLPNAGSLNVDWTAFGENVRFRATTDNTHYVPLVLWTPPAEDVSPTVLPKFETQWGAHSSDVARSLTAAERSGDEPEEYVNSGIYADCAFVSRTHELFERSIRIWLYVKSNMEVLSSVEFHLFDASEKPFDDVERKFELSDVRPKPIWLADMDSTHTRVAEELIENGQLPRVFELEFALPDDIEEVRTAQLTVTRRSEHIPDGATPIVLTCDEAGVYTATRTKKHFGLNQNRQLRSGYLMTIGQREERWQEIVNDPVISKKLDRDVDGHATNAAGNIAVKLEKGSNSQLLSRDPQMVRREFSMMEHREKLDERRRQGRRHSRETPEGKLGPDFRLDVQSEGDHAGRIQNIRSALNRHIEEILDELTLETYEEFRHYAQEQIDAVVKEQEDRDFCWLLLLHGLTIRQTAELLNDGRSYEALRAKFHRIVEKLKKKYQTPPEE